MSELMTCDHVEENINIYQQLTPKTDLCAIPGVGPNMKQHMIRLGYHWVEDLKQANPDEMYQQDCILHGGQLDRCVLYVYRFGCILCNNAQSGTPKVKMVVLERALLAFDVP